MEFRRKVGFGLSIAALGLMASILLVGPAGLQQGELEVWVPKSYFRWAYAGPPSLETYPWATLLNEFNRDFPKVKLRFKILEREEFLRVVHSTELQSHYPDMAFVDNWREVDPLISSGAVIRGGATHAFAILSVAGGYGFHTLRTWGLAKPFRSGYRDPPTGSRGWYALPP